MEAPIGLVLAGGLGKRLGRPKGEVAIGGVPLAERAARTLAELCRGVLISIRSGSPNPAPAFPALADLPPPGRGPLAGIHSAFEAASGADLLVLACDYPHVGPGLLGRLLQLAAEDDDIVFVADTSGRDHPLVGLWRRRVAGTVAEVLARGELRVDEVLRRTRVRRVGAPELAGLDVDALLLNVNRPADLERGEASWKN